MVYIFSLVGCLSIFFFFRVSVLLIPIWTLLTPKALLLIDTPNLPVISVYKFLCISLIVAYTFRVAITRKLRVINNPFNRVIAFLLAASMISVILNITSTNSGVLTLVTLVLEVFAPMYIFCHYISVLPTETLSRLAKKYMVFYCLLAMYGTACYLFNVNPYIEFIESTTKSGRVLARTYADTIRGIRAQGTISHPITYGALLVIGLLTYFTIKLSKKKFVIKDYLKVIIITVVIMLSVLFTNSRSPLIFFGIAVFTFATMQGVAKSLKSIITILIIFIITFSVSDVFRDKVYSVVNIFNPEVGENMNGSDLAMRGGQLAVSMKYFSISPIWGNGLDATRNIISSEQEEDLYNSESILFRLMIDQGVLGLIAYFMFFVALYKKPAAYISNAAARKMYLGFIIGYVIFTISTGIMDTLQNMMFMVCFIYYYFRNINTYSTRV